MIVKTFVFYYYYIITIILLHLGFIIYHLLYIAKERLDKEFCKVSVGEAVGKIKHC